MMEMEIKAMMKKERVSFKPIFIRECKDRRNGESVRGEEVRS
jgi:hypothetical protein